MLPLPRGAVWQMFFLLCAVLLANEVRSEGRVVCYYTNWSVYRPGAAKYNPQNINPYLCTHLVYAFGGFTKDNTMKPFDKYQDIEQGGYAKFTGLKTYNKQLKTMIAIGGWNEASTRFSPLVASSERRQQFIKNILKFLRQNHFDGIDLDWEYPAHREGGKSRDKDNYAQFVQELRTEFDRESAKTGRPRLLLTMAVPAGIQYIEKGYDIPKLNQYLDWFNLLTYDFHSSNEPSANHHAPLYSLEEDDEYNFDTELNIDYSIKYYLNAGADRDKLVLGIPTYGRSYTLINEDSTDIGAPSEGPGEQGDATREKGYLAYYEICQNIKDDPDWTVVQPNPSAMGPYAFKGNLWVGYDDEAIVRKKAEYVVENGLGGIMFWAIDNDDFRGTCTGKPYPLIEAAKEAYLDRLGVGANEVAKPASKKKPLRSRTRIGSSNRNKVEQVVEKAVAVSQKRTTTTKRPQSQRRTTTSTTTTGSSLYVGGRTTTPEPPTTPDPGSDFKCEDEGFFQHPRDCKKYFWCLDSGPSDLGIVAHMFTCPSGLYFNPAADSCDFARNVPCNKNPKDPPSTTSRPTTTTTTTTTARTTTASSRITAATSRNSFIRFTSTTTQAPEDDEEYEDEEDEPAGPESEEDPKVIKELIDLIKKVGGIEELEKHILQQEDGTVMFKKDDISSNGLTTTPPSISKSLYDKVLSRPNLSAFRNKFTSSTLFRTTSKPKPVEESEEEEEEVKIKSNSGSKYSSVVRNSRPGPQNAGIDKLPEFEGFLKEKKKYVTIQRTKPLLVSSDEVSTEDDQVKNALKDSEVEDEDSEDANVKISSRRPSLSSTPAYTSIRRTKSTTVKPEVVEEDLDDDDDLIVDKKTYTPLNRNRVRSTPADIETTTVAGSRYKFLERTRPTRRPTGTVTAKDDVDEESNGNDDELSVTVQYTDQNEISTQTPTQQPTQATTTRAYASLGRRTTTTPSSSTTTTTTDQVLTTTPESLVIDTTTTPEPIIITTTTTTITNPIPIETSTQSLTINPIPAISSTSTLDPSTTSQDDELVTIFPKIPNTLATESGLDTQEIDSTQNQILTETTTIDDTNRNEVTNLSTQAATTRIKSQSQSSLNINSSSTSSSNSIRGTLNNKFPSGGGRRQKTTTASSIDTNQQDQESSTITSTSTSTNEFLGTVSSPRPFGFPRRRTRPTTTTTTATVTGGLDDVASSTASPSDASTQLVKKVSSAQESYLRSSSRLSHNVEGTQNVNGGTSLVVDHVANVDDSLVKGDGVNKANTDGWQAKRTYSWKDARNPTLRYQKTYPKENLEKIANYYDWQIGSDGRRDDERFAQNGGWSTIWGQAYSPSLTYHDGSRYGGGYGVGLNGYKDFSGKYDRGSYVPDTRGKWRAKSLNSDGSTFRRGYGLGGQDIRSTFQSEDASVGGEYVYRGPRIYGDQSGSVDETFQANDNRGDGKYRADGSYRGWNGQSGSFDGAYRGWNGQSGSVDGANDNRGDGKYRADGSYRGWNGQSGSVDGAYRGWNGQSGSVDEANDNRGDGKYIADGSYRGWNGQSGSVDGAYRGWNGQSGSVDEANDNRGDEKYRADGSYRGGNGQSGSANGAYRGGNGQSGSVDETAGDTFQANDNRGDGKYGADGLYRGWNGQSGNADGAYRGWNSHSQDQAGKGVQGDEKFKFEGQYVGTGGEAGFDDGSYRWRSTSSYRVGINDARDGHQRQEVTKTLNGDQSSEQEGHVRGQEKHVGSGVVNGSSNNLNVGSRTKTVETTEFGLEASSSNVQGAGETSAIQGQIGLGLNIAGTKASQGTGATVEQGLEVNMGSIQVENSSADQSQVNSSAGHKKSTSVEESSSEAVKETVTGQTLQTQNQEDLGKSTLNINKSESSLASTGLQGTFEDRGLTKHNFLSHEVKTVSGSAAESANRTATTSRLHDEDEETYARRRNRNRLGSTVNEEVVANVGDQTQGSGQTRQQKISVSSEVQEKTSVQQDSLNAGGYAGSRVVDESVHRNKNLSIPRGSSIEEGLSSGSSSGDATSFKQENDSNSSVTTSLESGVHTTQGNTKTVESESSDKLSAHNSSQTKDIVAEGGTTVTEATNLEKATTSSLSQNKSTSEDHSDEQLNVKNSTLNQSSETYSSGFEKSKGTSVSSGENVASSETTDSSESTLSSDSGQVISEETNSESSSGKNSASTVKSLSTKKSAEVSSVKESGETQDVTRQRTLVRSYNRTTSGSTSGTPSRGRKIITSFGSANALNRTAIRTRTRLATKTTQQANQTVSVNHKKGFRAENQNLTSEAVESGEVVSDANEDITSSSQTSATTSAPPSVVTYRSRQYEQRRTYSNPTVASPKQRILTTRTQLRAQSISADLNKETVVQTSGSEGSSDETEYTQATYYEPTSTTTRRPRLINRGSFRPVFNDLSSLLALDVHAKHHRTTSTTAAPGQDVRRRRPVERTTTEASIVEEIQRSPRPTRPPRTTTTTEAPVPTVRPTSLHRANSQSQQDAFVRRRKIIRNRIQTDSSTSAGVSSNASATQLTSEDQTLRGDQLALKANLLSLLNDGNSTNATNGSMLAESEVKVNFESGSQVGVGEENIQDSVPKQSLSTAQVTRSRYTFQSRSKPTEVPTTTEIVEVVKPTIPRGKSRLNLPDLSSLLSPDFESKRRVNASVYRLQKTMKNLSASTTGATQIVGSEISNVAGGSLKSSTETDTKAQLEETDKESKSSNVENKTTRTILHGGFKRITTTFGSGIDVTKKNEGGDPTVATLVDGGSLVAGGDQKSLSETKTTTSHLAGSGIDVTKHKEGGALTVSTIVNGGSLVTESGQKSLFETKTITSHLAGSGIDVTKNNEGSDLTVSTIVNGGSLVTGNGQKSLSETKTTTSQLAGSGIDVTKHKEGGDLTVSTIVNGGSLVTGSGQKSLSETKTITSHLAGSGIDVTKNNEGSDLTVSTIVNGGSLVTGNGQKSLSETKTITSHLAGSGIDVTKNNEGSDLTVSTIVDGGSQVTGGAHTSLSATETINQVNSSDIDLTKNLANIDLQPTPLIESSNQLIEGGIKTTSTTESKHQFSSSHITTLDEEVTESPTTEDIQSATEELIATLETGFPLPAQQTERESIESGKSRLSSQTSRNLLTSEVVNSNQIQQQDDKYKTPTVPIFSRRNYYKYLQDSPIIYIGKIGGPPEANAEHTEAPKNAPSNNEINRTIFEVFDVYNDSSKSVAGKDKDVGGVTVRPQDNPPKTEADKNSIAYEINNQLQHFLVPAPRPINDLGADEGFTTTEVTLNEISDEMMKLAQDVNSMSVRSDLALLEGSGESSVEESDLEKDSSVNLAPSLSAKQGKSLFLNSIASVNALEINSMMDHSVHSAFTTKKPFGFRSYTSEEQYEEITTDSLFTASLEDTTLYTPVAEEPEKSLNSIIDYEAPSKQDKTTEVSFLDGLDSEITTISPSIGYAAEAETSTLIPLETDIEADSDTSSPLELFETQSSTESELESHRSAKTLKDRDTFKNREEDFNETGYELVGTSETASFSDRGTLNARRRPQTNTGASLVSGTGLYRRKGPTITSTEAEVESTTLKNDNEGVEIDETTINPSIDAKTPRRLYKSRVNLRTSSKVGSQGEGTDIKTASAVPSNQIESTNGGKFTKRIQTSENIGIDFTRAKGFTTRITTNRNGFRAVSQNKFELLNGADSKAEGITEAIDDEQNVIGSTVLPSILSAGSGFQDRSLLTARRQFGAYSRFRTTNAPSDLVTETSEVPDEESVTEVTNISRRPTINARRFNRIRTSTATEASLDLENDYATNTVNLDQGAVSNARRRFNRLRTTPASPFETADVTDLIDENVTTENEILEQTTAGTTRRTFNGFNRFRPTTVSPIPSTNTYESTDEEVTTDVENLQQSTAGTTRRTFAGFNRLRSTTATPISSTDATKSADEEVTTDVESLEQSTAETTRRTFVGFNRLRSTTESSNLVSETSEVPEEETETEIEILDQTTPSTTRRKIIGLRRLRTKTSSPIPSTDTSESNDEEVTTDVESLEQSTAGTTRRTFTGFNRLRSTTTTPILSTDATKSADEEVTTDVDSLEQSTAETTRRTFVGFNRLRSTTESSNLVSETSEIPEEETEAEIEILDQTTPITTRRKIIGLRRLKTTTANPIPDATESADEEVTTDVESLEQSTAGTTRRSFTGFNRLGSTTASSNLVSETSEVPEEETETEIEILDQTTPSTTRRKIIGLRRLRTTTSSPIPSTYTSESNDEEVTTDVESLGQSTAGTTRRTFNTFNRFSTTTGSPVPLYEDTEVPEEEIDNSDLTLPSSTTRRTFNGFNRLRTTTASSIPLSEDTEVPEEEIDNPDFTLPSSTTRRTFNGFNRLRTTTASSIPLSEDAEVPEEEIDNPDLTLPSSTTRRTFNGFNRLRTTTASSIPLSEDTEVPEEEIDNPDFTLPSSTTRRTFNGFNRLRTTTASSIPLSEDTEVPEEEIDNPDFTLPSSTTRRTFNGFNRLRTTTASSIPLSEDAEVLEEEIDNPDLTLPSSTTRRTFNGFNRLRTTTASSIPLSEDADVPEEEIDNPDLTLPSSTTRRTFNGFNRLRTTTASSIPLSEDAEVPEEEIDNPDLTLPSSTTRRTFNGFNRLRTTTASAIPLSEDADVPEEEIDNPDLTLPSSTTRRTFNGFNRLRTTTASSIPLSEDAEVPEEEVDNPDLTLPSSTTRRTFNGFNRLRTTTGSSIPLSEDTEVPEEEIDNSDLTLPSSTTRRTFNGFNRLRTTTSSSIPLSEDTEVPEEEIDNPDLTLPSSTTRRTFNGFNRLRTTTGSSIPLSEDTEVPEEEIDNSDLTLPSSTTRRTFNGFNRLRTTTSSSIPLSEDTEVPEEEIDNPDLTLPSSTTRRTFNGFNRLRTTTASSIPLSENTEEPEEEIDNPDLTLSSSTTRRTFNGFNRLRTTTASSIPLSEDAQITDEEIDINNSSSSARNQSSSNESLKTSQKTTNTSSNDIVSELEQLGLDIVAIDRTLLNGAGESHANIASIDINETETATTDPPENQQNEIGSEQAEGGSLKSTFGFTNAQQARPNFNQISTSSVKSQANRVEEELLEDEDDNDSKSDGSEEVTSRNIVALLNRNRFNPIASTRLEATEQSGQPESNRDAGIISTRLQRVFANGKSFNRTSILNNLTNRTITNFTVDTIDERTHTNLLSLTEANNLNTEQTELGPNDDSEPEDSIIENNSNLSTNTPNFDRRFQRVQFNRTAGRRRPNTTTPITTTTTTTKTTTRTTTLTQVNPSIDDVNVIDSTSTTNLGLTSETESESDSENGTSEDIDTGTSTEAAPKPRRRFRILKFKRPLIVNNSLSVEINNSTNTATVTSTTQTSDSSTGSVDNNNLGLGVGVNNNHQVGGKRFRKVIRRLRPVANRTVTSTEATAILEETTSPLNVAEFISQFNENPTTAASATDANELSTDDENLTTTLMPDTDTIFDTTISELIDNEVTSEITLTESTTSRPAPPTPRRLLVNRRPYRPTKPSINAITSTDSSNSIATQRTYVRKFNRNFKAIRPPSDSANGIGFIEQASGRPQTDFVGRNRFNFPTRTTTQSTRFENQGEEDTDEEDYDEATNVNQDEDERVAGPVLRPNVQFNLNQVQSQTTEGDNQEEDTEVNDADNESTEESEEEDEDEQTNKVSSLPPQVVYRPTRPSNRPSFNRPANTPFVPNRPSAAVPTNRLPGRAQNKTRVVNRPTLITLPPNLLDSDKPTVTASITPPSVFISTNTRSYERKYTATSTEAVPQDQSNPLLEDLNIDALNARNKKIFESNSKKHTTIKPKLIQNQPQPDTTDTPTNSFDTSTVFEEEDEDNEDNNLINSQEASQQTTTEEGITEQPTSAAEGELILYSPKQKLVTINRVVEVNSKEDKLRRKSKDEVLETVESTHLRPEGIPKLEALGEISRVKYVHLVDGSKILVDGRSSVTDYTPTESSVFVRNTIPEVALDSLENTRIDYEPGSTSAPYRNSVPDMDYSSSVSDSASDERKSKAITVPQVIVDVIESSTISLEGLFDAARQAKKINDASNEVNGIFYAYSLGEVPTTPKNEKPKLVSTTESTTPFTTTTTTTSSTTTTTTSTTTQTPETTTITTTSLPTPTTAPSQPPTSTTESADDTTTESTTAPVPAPLVSRPLIPLLRPESNEFPLVRTAGIQGRRPSIRRRLYATAQPVASASNDELNTDGISTISADDDAAVTSTTPATTSLFKYNRRTRPSYGTTTVAKLKPAAKVLSSSPLTSSPGEISTIISTTGSAVASSNDVTFVTVNKLPNKKFPSGVIRRKFIRPLNASRSTTTPPPSVTTVEVASGAASEEVAATTLPRTQNPLFKRRFPPTTTVAPLTTIRSTEFNTSPLYLDTLIPDGIDQVAKSSIQDTKIFHNQIGDTYGDSKHTPDISISTKLFRSTTPNYSLKDDEPITRRLDIIATTRRPLLRRPQKTTPIPEKAPIFISRRRPHKTPAPFSKIIQSPTPGKTYKPVLDYDYYDDGEERVVDKPTASQVKVVLHGKGIIECLDQGNFPHPLSCRKFISCAKFENGGVVGWEYTCPKGLSYDPVGGICNWAAGLGCKE